MNPPNSETPRTDALVRLHCEDGPCRTDHHIGMSNFARQLEKELNEAKEAIQLMEHGKYGRVDLSEQIRQLTSRLEASEQVLAAIKIGLQREFDDNITHADDLIDLMEKFIDHHKEKERANSEMREALKQLQQHQLYSGLCNCEVCISVRTALESLSSTSSQSYIPREVGEKMYEALGFAKVAFNKSDISLPFTEHKMDDAIQLAQSYGLGKDKLNENS